MRKTQDTKQRFEVERVLLKADCLPGLRQYSVMEGEHCYIFQEPHGNKDGSLFRALLFTPRRAEPLAENGSVAL